MIACRGGPLVRKKVSFRKSFDKKNPKEEEMGERRFLVGCLRAPKQRNRGLRVETRKARSDTGQERGARGERKGAPIGGKIRVQVQWGVTF